MDSVFMRVVRELSIDIPELGKIIEKARKAHPSSLTKLAKQAGMTPMNWYRIENEEAKTVPWETLKAMERVLGADFGIKLEGEVDYNPQQPQAKQIEPPDSGSDVPF